MEKNNSSYTSNFNTILLLLKNSVAFVIVLLIALLFLVAINKVIVRNFPLKLNSNVRTVITGDSHTKVALSPKIIKGSINVSQKAEPIYESYYKVKHILENNPNIENVVVGLSFHNLSHFNDLKLSHAIWSYEILNRTYPIIGYSELQNFEVDWWVYFKVIMKNYIFLDKNYYQNIVIWMKGQGRYKLPFTGGFNSSKKKLNKGGKWLSARINRHFNFQGVTKTSDLSLAYVDSLVNLSAEKQVELYFVNLPLHKRYRRKIPVSFKKDYQVLKKKLDKINHVKVLNQAYILDNDEYFKDFDHVNYFGATIVSEKMNKILSKR